MKSERKSEVLQMLMDCISTCENCTQACLQEDNVKEMSRCIRLNTDSADICTLSARFISRDSEHATHVLRECIEICRDCSNECSKHEHEHCRECARVCNECAKSCEEFLSVARNN